MPWIKGGKAHLVHGRVGWSDMLQHSWELVRRAPGSLTVGLTLIPRRVACPPAVITAFAECPEGSAAQPAASPGKGAARVNVRASRPFLTAREITESKNHLFNKQFLW